VIAVGLTACVSEKQEHANLAAQAKVSRADAEKTALAKAPGGTIKDGELEKEKGKLIWSFDIATPGTSDITEVQVDAITGEVVAVDKETAGQEAKEKKSEKDEKEENFHRIERRYGSFLRTFRVPNTIDSEHVDAQYEKGVLKLSFAKKAEAKPKQIKIGGTKTLVG